VALGYVRAAGGIEPARLEGARLELEIAGERFAARASLRAPYDPQGLRVKS
jgi:glycine cleavage system aminomethyltransferase T